MAALPGESASPQRFEFSPSLYLALMLFVAHTAAMLIVLLLLPAWNGVLPGLVLLGAMIYYILRDVLMRLPESVTSLELEGDCLILHMGDGRRLDCLVMPQSLVTPLLAVLVVRPHGGRLSRGVAILPDSLGEETFRRLRVVLRWQMGKVETPGQDVR